MRRAAVLVAVVLVALVSVAQGEETKEKGKTHDLTAEIVAVDLEGKTITIKDETGEELTVPVMEEAVADLGEVKKGDKVTVTCMDDENGQHTGITKIKPAEA
jgi:Cu/Ag efflux protein CusF